MPEEKYFDIENSFLCVFLIDMFSFENIRLAIFSKSQNSTDIFVNFWLFKYIFLMFPQKKTKGNKFSDVEYLNSCSPYYL